MAYPVQLGNYLPVTAWKLEEVIYVLDAGEAYEVHLDVEDHDLDELLAHVAGGVVLGPEEEPLDLDVVRGNRAVGTVHRRPGQVSTWTRLD